MEGQLRLKLLPGRFALASRQTPSVLWGISPVQHPTIPHAVYFTELAIVPPRSRLLISHSFHSQIDQAKLLHYGHYAGYEIIQRTEIVNRSAKMFEKSLYDLIRGLRNHKGNEKEYIQNSLKECRTEARGSDMDLKATALLKLVYLEMFGHDMSWAAFHVLEVMSSAKYLQKRVGYLGAVQSFRPDTEVLMLATNLLKKDLASPSQTTMTLPIITLPHVITNSLAMSVLADLLPRLSHSSANIRKKTIVTLYRLALVYPETLRPTWPKIKERLLDENEDPTVTAAIVNVVCELGWRRPQDFLPLAPRLFELLVDSGNNWMAIKLIKLFATLTPLEPRLVKKLLPPLTNIIRNTPAMSLLYECINGIIEGGILGSADESLGGQEIASLCVSKLRGMIMVDGDANLKYVALLAFNKIVLTHPYLVAEQEDVIMECIDSADMTIRLRALDLVVGMVNADNLMSVVGRLMVQLRTSPHEKPQDKDNQEAHDGTIEPMADSDDEAPEVNIKSKKANGLTAQPLPDDYRSDVIKRILEMCSSNNYSNLTDFDWYIDVLTQLVRSAPVTVASATQSNGQAQSRDANTIDAAESVGIELRNIAVKVKAVRPNATKAAESIIFTSYSGALTTGRGVLNPAAWIVGEFAAHLSSPEDTMTALIQLQKLLTKPEALAVYSQSMMKIFSYLAGDVDHLWTTERKTMVSLLMARIIHALEPLAIHPDLEVQERAVEFTELLKLTEEAAKAQETSSAEVQHDPPLLLTQAIPSLFNGLELNSVAPGAQRVVPMPAGLDLDKPINSHLIELLNAAESLDGGEADHDDFDAYYHQPQASTSVSSASQPAIHRLGTEEEVVSSYQQGGEESYLDPDIVARRRAERIERNKDDPFYIAGKSDRISGASTPIHNILLNDNGTDLDIDAIPIMQLNLGQSSSQMPDSRKPKSSEPRQKIQVAADEMIDSGASTPKGDESDPNIDIISKTRLAKSKQSLLGFDSSNIGAFSLQGDDTSAEGSAYDYEAKQKEDAEMAKAMIEVERLRLEMQRANERIQAAHGVDPDGTVVKKKKTKKKVAAAAGEAEQDDDVKPKKKKKKVKDTVDAGAADGGDVVVKRKNKKKAAVIDEGNLINTGPAEGFEA